MPRYVETSSSEGLSTFGGGSGGGGGGGPTDGGGADCIGGGPGRKARPMSMVVHDYGLMFDTGDLMMFGHSLEVCRKSVRILVARRVPQRCLGEPLWGPLACGQGCPEGATQGCLGDPFGVLLRTARGAQKRPPRHPWGTRRATGTPRRYSKLAAVAAMRAAEGSRVHIDQSLYAKQLTVIDSGCGVYKQWNQRAEAAGGADAFNHSWMNLQVLLCAAVRCTPCSLWARSWVHHQVC